MPQQLLCADPLHLTRVGRPGYQDVVGIRSDVDGLPIADPDGTICEACRLANLPQPVPFDPDHELTVLAGRLGTTKDKLVVAIKRAQMLPTPTVPDEIPES